MASASLKAATTDELRLKNYRDTLERRNDVEVRDIQAKHAQEIQKIIDHQTDQLEKMRAAYNVQISSEAATLDESLHETRIKNAQRVEEEKLAAEQNLAKLRAAHQERIEDYKQSSEAQYLALQKQLRTSAETLHEQSRKTARKQMEMERK